MEIFLKKIIVEAGEMAREYYDKGARSFTVKSHEGDFLTEADTAVNNFLVNAIQKEYPAHQVTSEELAEPINKGAEYEWVIDPLDGTSNFIRGVPLWCQIITVLKDGVQELGAVYVPYCRELYFAQKGGGAFLNEKEIHVSEKEDVDTSVGLVYRAHGRGSVYGQYLERYSGALSRLMTETRASFRHFGGMIDIVYLAKGSFDFYINNGGLDHDYLAPLLIAEEAGALVTDSDGNPWARGRQDVVAANPALHKQVMALFAPSDL